MRRVVFLLLLAACSGPTVSPASTAPTPAPPSTSTPTPSTPDPPAAPDPVPASEPKRATSEGDPYACSSAGDCVLSCPKAPGCCGYPCGCRHAINRRHAAAYEASYAETCDRAPCPAVDCAYQPAMSATCRGGRCVAVDGPGVF